MNNSSYSRFLLELIDASELNLDQIVTKIVDCISQRNSIWIMGNGGSASTAEHFETDLSFVRLGDLLSKIKVSALTANSSLITAIGNDIGFEYIFSHQLMRKAEEGDLCIFISASGNSKNLVNAVKISKKLELVTIGILGFDGGELASMVDFPIVVRTENGKYGPVEDFHLAICHELSALIAETLLKEGSV